MRRTCVFPCTKLAIRGIIWSCQFFTRYIQIKFSLRIKKLNFVGRKKTTTNEVNTGNIFGTYYVHISQYVGYFYARNLDQISQISNSNIIFVYQIRAVIEVNEEKKFPPPFCEIKYYWWELQQLQYAKSNLDNQWSEIT